MPKCVVCETTKPAMFSKLIKGMSLVICSDKCEDGAKNGAPVHVLPSAV